MLPALADAKPSKRQDLAILNYALTLEYLEADFYAGAVDSGALSGSAAVLAALISAHEATHVTVLRNTILKLGGRATAKPSFDFKGTNTDPAKFVATALVLENTGVRAYLGQAGNLKSKALLAAAGSILTIEARHAAAVAVLLDDSPYADGTDTSITPASAFDKPATMARILREVAATGFIKAS
jgi:hypothetical protein